MIITAGIYKGRKIISPDEKITRPTLSKTRMGLFNSLYSLIGDFEGKTFLDLFGGSGIIGLEALSRGFGEVTVYELNKKSADIIKKNYTSLNLKPNLVIGDSIKLLSDNKNFYDVVFIDPPYKSNLYKEALEKINGNIIIVEHSDLIDFKGFDVLKQKKYSSSYISFITKNADIQK